MGVCARSGTPRGGGAGSSVQGELTYVEGGSGNLGWNVTRAGQTNPILPRDAGDRQLRPWVHPVNAASRRRWRTTTRRPLTGISPGNQTGEMSRDDQGLRRPQLPCTRRVTGEFNNDNMLERVVTWFADPVKGTKWLSSAGATTGTSAAA